MLPGAGRLRPEFGNLDSRGIAADGRGDYRLWAQGHHTGAGTQGDASALGHPLYSQRSTCMFGAGHFYIFSSEGVIFPPTVPDASFAVVTTLCNPQCLPRVKGGLPGA